MIGHHVWLLCVCFSSGASERAFIDPLVWLTALLTTWMAILPSVTALAINVILTMHDKHKVRRLYEKGKNWNTKHFAVTWMLIKTLSIHWWDNTAG